MQKVHFYVHLVVDNGALVLKNKGYGDDTVQIEFDSNFSNQSDPSDTTITVHGVTPKTADYFYNGASVDLYAGYFNIDYTDNDIGYVMGGTVSSLNPLYNNSGDWQLSFTITDGAKYDSIATIKREVSVSVRNKSTLRGNPKLVRQKDNEIKAITAKYKAIRAKGGLSSLQKRTISAQERSAKQAVTTKYKAAANQANKDAAKSSTVKKKIEYKPISFKPGTTGQSIISTLASKAGITIKKMKLVKDKSYKDGYVAKKRPYQCIVEIAHDCNTDVFYQHGGLNIAGYADQYKIQYVATKQTGIITPPQLQVDDSTDSTQSTTSNSKTKKQKNHSANQLNPNVINSSMMKNGVYQMTISFNSQITTGSVFMVKDEMTNFNDWVIVNSGEHSYSPGSTPQTQINFELYSKYRADQSNKAAQEASQAKTSKSKAARNRTKNARRIRTLNRLAVKGGSNGTTRLLNDATKKSIR